MLITKFWKDYTLLDAAQGEKLERWGSYYLRRPDPQIVWGVNKHHSYWDKPDAHYMRSNSGGGHWEFNKKLPEKWVITYKHLSFYVKPMNFKHTGIFPEQSVNWDWMIEKIKQSKRPIQVLNLFSYTGGATVACASAGASVCHVDSAKGIVSLAKENLKLSGLESAPVRFIVDDVVKFVTREIKRGNRYDAIIMDPPSYGRGINGEVWAIEQQLYFLLLQCLQIMSKQPLFFLINSYTTSFSPTVLSNLLHLTYQAQFGGNLYSDEIGIPLENNSSIILPCGGFGRWES